MTIRDIARECKVDESTVYRWQQSENFTDCLRRWKYRLFDEVDGKGRSVVMEPNRTLSPKLLFNNR